LIHRVAHLGETEPTDASGEIAAIERCIKDQRGDHFLSTRSFASLLDAVDEVIEAVADGVRQDETDPTFRTVGQGGVVRERARVGHALLPRVLETYV